MKRIIQLCGLMAAAAMGLSASTSYSFTGTFGTDDQIQIFDLSLAATTTVTFETLSYGGGMNAAGASILPGGFDPRLTWFQADGTEIGFDNGGHCGVTASYLGACNDAYFQGTLAAGNYILVLTEDGNDANGNFSDGFSQQGNGDFTATGTCPAFCDSLSGAQLTGNWAVDILGVGSASAVPEPGAAGLIGIGLALAALGSRKLRGSARKDRHE